MRIVPASLGLSLIGLALATGLAVAAPPAATTIKDATGASFTGDAAAGEKTFRQCAACHKMEAGKHGIGPSLNGVSGKKAGTTAGYTYSGQMKNSGIVWNDQNLADYLENPRKKVQGTKMTFAGLRKPQDRANVIAYIKKAGGGK